MGIRSLLTCVLFVASFGAPAQTPLTVSSGAFAHPGALTGRHVVRGSSGVLYLATIDSTASGDRPVALYSSFDGGATWSLAIAALNDAGSGLTGPMPTNTVSLAIDDQDRLHFRWASFYYPSNYATYYRQVQPATYAVSPIVDLNAVLGVAATSRTTACHVAVGPAGTIWLTTPSATSWRSQLLRSNVPYAVDLNFTSVGVISQTASAQSARIAVDLNGVVHCTYYENTGSGDYRHRAYDPTAATWSGATDLGNGTAPNDFWGEVACDFLGNTHLICLQDGAAGGAAQLVYYVRDAAGTFTGPTVVMSTTAAQFAIANQYIVSLACDEGLGDAYVLYRDLAGAGDLVLAIKPLAATSFVPLTSLTPPSTNAHEYYSPRIRGSLWPLTNVTGTELHLTWRQGTAAPYTMEFANYGGNDPMISHIAFSPTATASPGAITNVEFRAPLHPNEIYLPVLSCTLAATPIPGTPYALPVLYDGCSNLYFNNALSLAIFQFGPPLSYLGTLDGNGMATGQVVLPATFPAGLNIPLALCFVTINGVNASGVSEPAIFVLD